MSTGAAYGKYRPREIVEKRVPKPNGNARSIAPALRPHKVRFSAIRRAFGPVSILADCSRSLTVAVQDEVCEMTVSRANYPRPFRRSPSGSSASNSFSENVMSSLYLSACCACLYALPLVLGALA